MRRSEFIDIALNLIANTFETATTANDGTAAVVGTVVGTAAGTAAGAAGAAAGAAAAGYFFSVVGCDDGWL